MNIAGGPATLARTSSTNFSLTGGNGGNSILGGGGMGKGNNVTGPDGGLYGAGSAAGIGGNCGANAESGFGAQGVVIFEY
jgi:hypothetical protein